MPPSTASTWPVMKSAPGVAKKSAAAATSHPAIVAHHVGFYEDDYTMQESYTYMYEFGVGGAPTVPAGAA